AAAISLRSFGTSIDIPSSSSRSIAALWMIVFSPTSAVASYSSSTRSRTSTSRPPSRRPSFLCSAISISRLLVSHAKLESRDHIDQDFCLIKCHTHLHFYAVDISPLYSVYVVLLQFVEDDTAVFNHSFNIGGADFALRHPLQRMLLEPPPAFRTVRYSAKSVRLNQILRRRSRAHSGLRRDLCCSLIVAIF